MTQLAELTHELQPITGRSVQLDTLCIAYVLGVVIHCRGNKSAAARRLGISRRALYRWLQRKPAGRATGAE